MSIQAVAWVLDHSRSSGSEWAVMVSLANHCDEYGYCWPSIDRIGREARLSESTARRALQSCVAHGELQGPVPPDELPPEVRFRYEFRRPDRRPNVYLLVALSTGVSDRHPAEGHG